MLQAQIQQKLSYEPINEYIKQIGQSLTWQEKQSLVKSILKKEIKTAIIRETLCHEGQKCLEGFLLFSGAVSLSRRGPNKLKINLAQLSGWNIINMQARTNKWLIKYTTVVVTSYVKYILLDQQQLLLLYNCQKSRINNIEKNRDREYNDKVKKQQEKSKKQKKEDLLKKLSLPQIFVDKKSKSPRQQAKSQSKQKKDHHLVSNAQLNTFSSKQLNKFRQHKNQPVIKEAEVNYNDFNRNQKIFKQQLKGIIKRKLIYERTHLAVLKAFRNDMQKEEKQGSKEVGQEANKEIYLGQKYNRIDEYFKN